MSKSREQVVAVDFFDTLNNFNEKLLTNAENFKALASQLDDQLNQLRNNNDSLLQNAATREMATGISTPATPIPNALVNAVGTAIDEFNHINTEAPKLLQKIGIFAGVGKIQPFAQEINADLSASISAVQNKNLLAMQTQVSSLYRLMETEIVKKDDASITKLKALANELNKNMTAYLNAGQELKQKSAQTFKQQSNSQPENKAPRLGGK